MIRAVPGADRGSPGPGGEVWSKRAGSSRDSASKNRQICTTWVPVVMWIR